MNLRGVASTLLLAIASVILCITTVVFAPLPLMLIRRNGGRLSFAVATCIGIAFLFWSAPLSITLVYVVAALTTLIFSECENQNIGYSASVFVSLLVICGLGALALGYGIQNFGFEPAAFFRQQIDLGVSQLNLPAGVVIDKEMKESFVKQVPSILLMMLVFSIWLNSVLVSRVEKVFSWKPNYQKHVFESSELRKWKVPDSFVWIALVATAGTFLDFEPAWIKGVASNIFNLSVMLYFFQGLAVVVDFFVKNKVGLFWRGFTYILIFSQLFFMVSFLGFVDFWVGFRDRPKTDKSAVA